MFIYFILNSFIEHDNWQILYIWMLANLFDLTWSIRCYFLQTLVETISMRKLSSTELIQHYLAEKCEEQVHVNEYILPYRDGCDLQCTKSVMVLL